MILLHLLAEIVGFLAPLIDKIFGQTQISLFLGNLVQFYQCQLNNFMSRISVQLSFLGSDALLYQIHIAHQRFEQLVLSGGLIVSDGPFQKMSQTVQLMVVHQTGKTFVQSVDDIIGIQITVGLLGSAYNVDGFIGGALQLRVRVPGQRIGYRFQPFGKITVLENMAAEGPGFHPGGNAEVVHTVAGGSSFNLIVEGFPLVWNYLGTYQFLKPAPKAIGDGHL